jgi:hypothetical protein
MTNREKALEEALEKYRDPNNWKRSGRGNWCEWVGANNGRSVALAALSLPATSTEMAGGGWRPASEAPDRGYYLLADSTQPHLAGVFLGQMVDGKAWDVNKAKYVQADLWHPVSVPALTTASPAGTPEGWLTADRVEEWRKSLKAVSGKYGGKEADALCTMALWALVHALQHAGLEPVAERNSEGCGQAQGQPSRQTASAPSAWRSMEDAPKDGTLVLLWDADREGCSIAFWLAAQTRWVSPFDSSPDAPTAWMPLPPPPSSDEASR